MTPAHLEVLEQRLGTLDLTGHVRALVIGGEALHESTLQYWRKQAPGTRLINEYGPTETVVGCCVYEAARMVGLGDVLIGRPIANAQMHVLDGNLEPVPVGVAGEIYIGGAGVGRGYWGRAELTAERFVPDGLSGDVGARLYRTGDRARYRADGEIEYLGRLDDQVKIRGYRVELGEIEATLAQHTSVGQAAVVLRAQASGDQRLIAYVSASAGETPVAAELRAYLKERLPEYEVALGLRGAGANAADGERQGGPQSATGTGRGVRGRGTSGTAHGGGKPAERNLGAGGSAGRGAVGDPRQFLRFGRGIRCWRRA